MTRSLVVDAEVGDAVLWRERCGQCIKELEPRLGANDCIELAATLWQLPDYAQMEPDAAAERFMADNPCASDAMA